MIDALPKSAQPAAKAALAEIWSAEAKNRAETALAAFAKQYSAKFLKAVAKLTDDEQALLAFFDYPRSTGSICAPRTPSSPRSPPSGCVPRSPAGPAPAARRWR